MSFENKRKNAPKLGARKNLGTDFRVSVCVLCNKGIFQKHDYVWSTLGYVHKECEEETANETARIA